MLVSTAQVFEHGSQQRILFFSLVFLSGRRRLGAWERIRERTKNKLDSRSIKLLRVFIHPLDRNLHGLKYLYTSGRANHLRSCPDFANSDPPDKAS